MHVAAVITVLGALLAHQEFPTTAAGYRQLLSWARSFGILHRAGVECTGSYGAALARFLHRENVQVIEVNQPDRAIRRKRGKTDAVDADAAARAVLSGRATTTPKTGEGPGRRHARPETGQGIGRQGPYPGDEPAQGRTTGHRS
ncbi:transposase [Streptomyces sp. F001]|uniref:IS110 family transposase n=1 Tax=Streptomyces sp. F001 TaxID=1510026 RepID=UPI003207CAE8